MSVILICSHCNRSTSLAKTIEKDCMHCRQPFPPEALRSAEQALRRERPTLITVSSWAVQWLAVPFSAFCLLSLVPGCPAGPSIGGRSVSQREWAEAVGPLIVSYSGLLLALAYGLKKERAWTRHLLVALFFVPLVSLAFPVSREIVGWSWVPDSLAPLLFWLWYLYSKANVVDYYRELQGSSFAREVRKEHHAR